MPNPMCMYPYVNLFIRRRKRRERKSPDKKTSASLKRTKALIKKLKKNEKDVDLQLSFSQRKERKRVKALRPGPARVHAHSLTALERKLAIPFVVISSGAKRWQKKRIPVSGIPSVPGTTRVRLQTHRQPSGLSCEELISNSGGGKFDRHSG